MNNKNNIAPINRNLNVVKYETENITNLIYTIRGKQVMLDSDVAMLYHYETKYINLAVRRNKERFPENFCFQLTQEEISNLRLQIATSSLEKENYGGRRYLPYVFTEQGIAIDSNITIQELRLESNNYYGMQDLRNHVCYINDMAIQLLNGLISLKERLLNDVLCCKVFTANYPLLLEHILREAKLYRQYVICLQRGENIEAQNMKQVELFWNQIMMEHALFIRGLLDPTENDLIVTADNFAKEYEKLLQEARNMTDETIKTVTDKTIAETQKYIEFKTAGTKGIKECEIRSIILPLLADHVLREANHYFRILKS